MKNNIKFYMVPSSPWSFLSLERIEKISNSYNLDLDLIPIDIFKLFELQDIKVLPKRSLAIQKNRINELKRWKDYLKIQFNIKPKYFPVNPNKSCKLIIANSLMFPDKKKTTFMLAKSLSEAVWVNDLNIDDDKVIFEVAKNFVNMEKIKDRYFHNTPFEVLQKNTIDAFNQDIFGVPTFIYNNQMFWGQDRIFFLEKEIRKLNV